jgi:hypothetical protein
MALSGRNSERMARQLLGVKRPRHGSSRAATNDPKRTWGGRRSRDARRIAMNIAKLPALVWRQSDAETHSAWRSYHGGGRGASPGNGVAGPGRWLRNWLAPPGATLIRAAKPLTQDAARWIAKLPECCANPKAGMSAFGVKADTANWCHRGSF